MMTFLVHTNLSSLGNTWWGLVSLFAWICPFWWKPPEPFFDLWSCAADDVSLLMKLRHLIRLLCPKTAWQPPDTALDHLQISSVKKKSKCVNEYLWRMVGRICWCPREILAANPVQRVSGWRHHSPFMENVLGACLLLFSVFSVASRSLWWSLSMYRSRWCR